MYVVYRYKYKEDVNQRRCQMITSIIINGKKLSDDELVRDGIIDKNNPRYGISAYDSMLQGFSTRD